MKRRNLIAMIVAAGACAALLATPGVGLAGGPEDGAATRQAETQPQKNAEKQAEKNPVGDPYTLDICIVSGQKLDSKGKPVVKQIDGREIRFCCNGCPKMFERAKDDYIKKLDAKIVEDQTPHYPLTMCVVESEDSLFDEDGKFTGTNYVHNNRLLRFCCDGCIKDFQADPAKYIARLDQAVIEKQAADYPLSTCPVSGEALGSMGAPVEKVVANRLVKFCCKGCLKELENDPAAVIAKVDAARKARHAGAGR